MSGAALALALGAAVLHALWNLLLAGSRDVLAATAVALGSSLVVALPFALATWEVEREAMPWLVASGALELVYFLTLAAAYQRAELSLVYPLARGGAPVLVLLGAVATGYVPGGIEVLGVLAVAAGVVLVRGLRGGDRLGVVLGLVIAAQIAAYTLVDSEGIQHANPVPYLLLALVPTAVGAALVCGRQRLHAEWGARRSSPAAAASSPTCSYSPRSGSRPPRRSPQFGRRASSSPSRSRRRSSASGSRGAACWAPSWSSRASSHWAPHRPNGLLVATLPTPHFRQVEMGALRPFLLKEPRILSATHEQERTLTKQIGREVEAALPGVEVLAVELQSPERFTVFVDHAEGVDHALCARVTDVLREYQREYAIDVSSPGIERPVRTPEHFRNAIGRTVTLRTPERKHLKGEVVSAGQQSVVVRSGDDTVEIPYDQVVRGNLVYEQ